MAELEIDFSVAEGADAVAFLDFMTAVAEETDFLAMDEGGLDASPEALARHFDSQLGLDNQLCLLAKHGEEVIGVLNIKADHRDKLAHIGDVFIAVRKPYWGQGLGSALLEEALYWAEQTETIKRLELTVQARNSSAIALYKKHGFELEGTKKRGAKSRDGAFLDVHLMAKMIG